MEDIFTRLSSSVDGSLPKFVNDRFDQESKQLLEAVDASWATGVWYDVLIRIERYLDYTFGDVSVIATEYFEILIDIAKKLWTISMFNTLNKNKTLRELYDISSELEHIGLYNKKITLRVRSLSMKLLNSVLEHFLAQLPSIWESDYECLYSNINEKLNFICVEVILAEFRDYFERDYASSIATSVLKKTEWVNSLVTLSGIMRHIWLLRDDIGNKLLISILGEGLETDNGHVEVFLNFRLVALLCPNITIYKRLIDGTLFKWWDSINGDRVSAWNLIICTLLFRAVKFGWATGKPLYSDLSSRIPQLFNISYLSFNIPNRVPSGKVKEKIPNLYSLLSDKRTKIYKKLAKTLALLMPPKCDCTKSTGHDIFDYLTALVNTIYPYTHPSNNGKWTTNIARFTKNFIAAYARRVCRERTVNRTKSDCGMYSDGEKVLDYKLNNSNDKFVADLFYSLALQGLHSRHPQVSNAYEDVIKRLCYIQPDPLLNIIVEHMVMACDSVTEPHQVITAVRIFYHLSALIIKYIPEALLSILDVTIKGIDTSDPFKTGQTLILVNVIFSQIPCIDLSDVEFSHEDKCRCLKLCYSKFCRCTDGDFVKEMNSLELGRLESIQGGLFNSSLHVLSDTDVEDEMSHLKVMKRLENCTSLEDGINFLDIILAQRRHVSQHFPIWCLNWFDSLLRFVSQLTKPNMTPNSLMNTLDIGTFVLLRSAVVTILSQVDLNTATEVYTLFYKWFINSTSRKDPLKHMTAISSCLSYANPKLAVDYVFKPLFARLKHEFEVSDFVSDHIDEDRLIWYISCISGIVRFSNVHILPYIDDMIHISNIGVKHKSKLVFKSCAKLISRSVYSLISVYFVDSKSISDIVCDGENKNNALILWDVPWFAKNFSREYFNDSNSLNLDKLCHINWHIAGNDEINAAKMMLNWFISQILSLAHGILNIDLPLDISKMDCLSSDHNLTVFNRINRICIICKYILKGLKDFAVDDRDFDTYGLPFVTPVDFTSVLDAQKVVKSVILSIIEKYGAFSDSKGDLTVTNILMKLLKLVNLYIVRNAHSNDDSINDKGIIAALKNNCNVGIIVTASRSMFSSLSYYYGLSRLSFWQDVPRAGWLSIVYDRYQNRLNLRKLDHESTNERTKMLEVVLSCATCHYKQLSLLARTILKDFVLVHKDIRNFVIEYVLDKGLYLVPKSNSDSHESEALATIPEILEISLIERILSCDKFFSKFVKFICSVVSTAPNNGNLMMKYDSLFVLFLNAREEHMTSEYNSNVSNNMLDFLFGDNSNQKQGTLHWRFQLYCTCVLVAFNLCVSKENVGRYIEWLIEACDHTSKHACVISAALVGLLPFFADVPSNHSGKLMDDKAVYRILSAIPFVNHDSIRQSTAPSLDVSNTLISIIISSVSRPGKPWPNNRISSNSNSHSTYNFIFCYNYFNFLFSNNSINNIETVKNVLDSLSQSPQSSPENHIGFFEISCSLMKASLLLPLEEKTTLWDSICPLMKREIDSVTLDRISDFMDSLRLTFDGYKLEDHALYIPIFNLAIDGGDTPRLSQLSKFSTFDDYNGDTTGHNLQVVKKLRLLQAILQQLNKSEVIIKILLPAILNENALFNSSQQIRNEVSHLCSLIVSICCDGPAGFKIYKEKIHSKIFDFIKDTEPRITFAEEDCSRIRGLLAVISLLFSSSVPTIDLEHSYISSFLEFALKLSRHTSEKINKLAVKAISNIAMSSYYIKDQKLALGSIESTLVKMIKVPQYKVRLCTIHAAEMLQRNLCMYIRNTEMSESLLNLYISSLQDTQTRDAARDALTAIAISANDDTYLDLTQRFFQLVKNDGDLTSVSSGVFGLAALVSTAPYHVPSWMPHTLTTLASCASSKFPISIRNIVQRTLQEFFKSHVDAWSQIHVYKFTRQQLEILHMYKGCPVYFN